MKKIVDSMLELIGNIPLVRLNRIGKTSGCEILAKPEFLNPSGSIKDRIAKYMIESAELAGILHEGSIIVEASTGNTGTSLSFVGALKGYKVEIYTPAKVSNPIRRALMEAFGPQIISVETSQLAEVIDGADTSVHGGRIEIIPRQLCRKREKEDGNVWWARQFSSQDNVRAHRRWTGREIIEQTDGEIDGFVASVGTGGTLLGIAQALKELNQSIIVGGVEPSGNPILAGNQEDFLIIEEITDGIMLDLFSCGIIDRVYPINDQEAISMAHRLAQEEGILCGISSGANVLAALKLAEELGPGKRIVTVLPDSRDRYLAEERYTT
jgi:cysteine synthase A